MSAFHITGHLWEESTGNWWIPVMQSFEFFFDVIVY